MGLDRFREAVRYRYSAISSKELMLAPPRGLPETARGTMTRHPVAWQQCTNRRDNVASQVESGGRSTTHPLDAVHAQAYIPSR
jgi:hypothetical protein